VEKTKTSRKRKKHKLSCKKARKKKKRLIKEICPLWVIVFSILPNNQKKLKKSYKLKTH
jgi:hypothetical protein